MKKSQAVCISADTGLPTLRREDVPIALRKRLEENMKTKIDLPWENIEKWKGQFNQV